MTGREANSVLTVTRFLQHMQATTKQAGTYEPGSIGGETSHISKNVDGNTFPKQEGEHSAENNKDVKEQVGSTAIIGEGKEGKKKEAIDSIPTPGLSEAPTGEDPENEKPKKTTKDDNCGQRLGRTTHVARADNPGLDKIAFDELPLDEHVKIAADLGNQLLARISVSLSASVSEAKQAAAPAPAPAPVNEAAQLGWELAGAVDGSFDKRALDQVVQNSLQQLIKTAYDDADNIVDYLSSFHEAQTKSQPVKRAGGPPPGMGGPPPGAGGPPPGAEGPPPGAEGPPPGAEGAEGGEGGGEEEILAMLEQIAQQQGISVEELISQLMASGGEGGAGGEGAGGGAGAAPGMEVAASQKTAAVKTKTAAPKKASATETTRAYVQELLNRSKA